VDPRAETAGQSARMTIHASSSARVSDAAMDTGDYWLYSIGLALVVAIVVFAG
jgi:hypothetical protein